MRNWDTLLVRVGYRTVPCGSFPCHDSGTFNERKLYAMYLCCTCLVAIDSSSTLRAYILESDVYSLLRELLLEIKPWWRSRVGKAR